MVAILSVGSARSLMLRPRGGGASLGFSLGHGDLVVMGGSCQRTWDHAIPKTTQGRSGRGSRSSSAPRRPLTSALRRCGTATGRSKPAARGEPSTPTDCTVVRRAPHLTRRGPSARRG